MARIKSALELAMERVEDIQSDPEQLRRDTLRQRGRRLAGSFIHDIDKTIEETTQQYDAVAEEDKKIVKQAIIETIIVNITLPHDDMYVSHLGKLKSLASILSDSDDEIMDVFVQIDNLYAQYLQTREQLKERVTQQYMPQLERKKQLIAQQTGQEIDILPEQDKEFLELLHRTYQQLDTQYSEILDQLRDSLKSFI